MVEGAVVQKRPWYDPAEKPPTEPIISAISLSDLDSLVVDAPLSGEPLQLEFARVQAAEGAGELATPEDEGQPAALEEKHSLTTASATARPEERLDASDRPPNPRKGSL